MQKPLFSAFDLSQHMQLVLESTQPFQFLPTYFVNFPRILLYSLAFVLFLEIRLWII